jgi:bifunctional DNA-binding transcriptional regulator/antitoxin component of YhaV-PrlF toxin-antitoxin module
METFAVHMQQRGAVTLPLKLRKRYSLDAGDTLSIIDLDGVFVVAPRVSLVSKLAAEIEQIREEAGLSMDDLLEGLDKERRRIYEER